MEKTLDWRFSPNLIKWIKKNIPVGSNILEFGSGEGSIELSEQYNMFCIEHDIEWIKFGESSHVNYIYAPLKKHKPVEGFEHNTWYDPKIIANALETVDYDTVIVDGPPGCIGRSGFLKYLDNFNLSGNLLMDDVHREQEAKLAVKISKRIKRAFTVNDAWDGKAWAYFHPKNNII